MSGQRVGIMLMVMFISLLPPIAQSQANQAREGWRKAPPVARKIDRTQAKSVARMDGMDGFGFSALLQNSVEVVER